MVLLIIFYSSLSFGQVYKWVDEKGKIHFSDKSPPASYQSIEMEAQEPASGVSSPPSTLSTQGLLRGYNQRRQEKKQQRTEEKKRKAAIKKRCASLQQKIKYYDGYRHLRTDSNGEAYYLSDIEITQEKQRTEAIIRKHCRQ